MTKAQAVAKARRELKKIFNSDYKYLSNEYFKIGKLKKFIELYVNSKGNKSYDYHIDCLYAEKELNDILSWDISQLDK